MPKQNIQQLAFNRGVVSPLSLGRIDQESIVWSAEEMTNFMPRVLGSAMLRVGTEYIDSTRNNLRARHIPFVFSSTDTAIIEFTDLAFRVRVNEEVIVRPSVSSTVTNGSFATDLTGWTDNDEVGASSTYSDGFMQLLGTGTNKAIRRQEVSVSSSDRNTEHALRIIVSRGEVSLRIGTSEGDDDYIQETILGRGEHSIAFTPTNNFWIEVSSVLNYAVLLEGVEVEASGDMVIPTPVTADELDFIRFDSSGDIIYFTFRGKQQRKIERRNTRSWSFVYYEPKDGPFLIQNVSTTTIQASALTGNSTLTASRPIFDPEHVGALFKLVSSEQTVTASISSEATYTSTIRVTGVGTSRQFSIVITGTWVGTITLQRSFDEGGSWEDLDTYTANTNPTASPTFNDDLDNQIVLYRIGFNTGDYTSGTAVMSLQYQIGSITGIGRITSYTNNTTVEVEVLKDFGSVDPTSDWSEGVWSDARGYPTAVAFHEGRLWFAGVGRYIGSVSDAYESFDDDVEGDSGVINKTIGKGAFDEVNWLLSSDVLALGSTSGEKVIRSTTFGDILTPSTASIKTLKNIGSSDIQPVLFDQSMIFVSGSQIYEIETISATEGGVGFRTIELTLLSPEICEPFIKHIAIQRRKDVRIHCLRSDGKVAILVYNPTENIKSWVLWEADGEVEDIIIMRGESTSREDTVYYQIKRTINGSDVRYLEKWGFEDEAQGGVVNKLLDSSKSFDLLITSTVISELDHLAGETVTVWNGTSGTGVVMGEYVVTNVGNIILEENVTKVTVGLAYSARMKSTKLPYAAARGTPLNQVKRVGQIGFVLYNTILKSLKFGTSYDYLDVLPAYDRGNKYDNNFLWPHYDSEMVPLDGTFETDPRLHIAAQSPYPCTMLALTADIKTNDK